MRWCLRVKLAQNWSSFGHLLLSTGDAPIVENSRKDDFWGAKPTQGVLVGMNILGRLLLELRENLKGPDRDNLRVVEPLQIPDFSLNGQSIGRIAFLDEQAPREEPLFVHQMDTIGASQVGIEWRQLHQGAADPRDSSLASGIQRPLEERERQGSNGMIPKDCKRLAEVDFPIAEISKHAAREKSIRHGHPSTLHLWWARRPLASSRAVLMALLLPDPCDPLCPDTFKTEARRALLDLRWRARGWNAEIETDEGLRKVLLRFIADFANWDNAAKPDYLETGRALARAAHPEEKPLVVDPFAGGGSIPLEALRLGCETFASDLNPVACLILR